MSSAAVVIGALKAKSFHSMKIEYYFSIISCWHKKLFTIFLFPKGIVLSFKNEYNNMNEYLGPVVQSIVSLTSLLRGQLVKCFTTL